MEKQNDYEKEILWVLAKISESIKFDEALNEYYIHHYFTYLLQSEVGNLIDLENPQNSILHPHWPTYKRRAHIKYSLYTFAEIREDGGGKSAEIDFTIGNYRTPHIGIEFKLLFGWDIEGITFDLTKLLYIKNRPFKTVFSYNIILKNYSLTRKKYNEKVKETIPLIPFWVRRSLGEDRIDKSRKLHLIIGEISPFERRFWYANEIVNPEKENIIQGSRESLLDFDDIRAILPDRDI